MSSACDVSDGGGVCSIFNCTQDDLLKSGFYRTKLMNNIMCCGCGWESGDDKVTFRHINFLHKLSNPDCKMNKNIEGGFNNYLIHRKHVSETEDMMRETFISWPKLHPLIDDLVEAGFYYTGSGDAVCCIECNVMLEAWMPEDNPKEEHRKASPNCKLLSLYK